MPRKLPEIPVPALPEEAAKAVCSAPSGQSKVDIINRLFRIAMFHPENRALLAHEAVGPSTLPVAYYHDQIVAALPRTIVDGKPRNIDIHICSPEEMNRDS